jgi:hypothetical protein
MCCLAASPSLFRTAVSRRLSGYPRSLEFISYSGQQVDEEDFDEIGSESLGSHFLLGQRTRGARRGM